MSNPLAALQALYSLNDAQRFPSFADDGKRPSTLFYADFKVAEAFGLNAIKETMERCGNLATRAPAEVTELYIVLNHLIWDAYERGNTELRSVYQIVYDRIDGEIVPAWSDADRSRFYQITD